MSNAVNLLRSCRYTYPSAISEPKDNELRIVVLEATTGASLTGDELASEPDEALRTLLAGTEAIEYGDGCRRPSVPVLVTCSDEDQSFESLLELVGRLDNKSKCLYGRLRIAFSHGGGTLSASDGRLGETGPGIGLGCH